GDQRCMSVVDQDGVASKMNKVARRERAERICSALISEGAALVEVFSKEGVSVRSFLAPQGAITSSLVHEEGVAVRAWSAAGAPAFASWAPDPSPETVVRTLAGPLRTRADSGAFVPELPARLEASLRPPESLHNLRTTLDVRQALQTAEGLLSRLHDE